MKSRIYEVKYFHPSGRDLPNGSHYQKGGFFAECKRNKDSFVLTEGAHEEQSAKYRGGIIMLADTINTIESSFDKDIIHNVVDNFINNDAITNREYIGAYSIGNFFKGKYVGKNGDVYDDKSVCVEVDGLSSKSLLKLAETIADNFRQETLLVKDLNKNKIYLRQSTHCLDI